MKKVILCGATHGSNFGDSLFSMMFKESISSQDSNVEVLYTNLSSYSQNLLGLKKARKRDYFTADAFIYISGGYFGQSPGEKLRGAIRRFRRYMLYGLFMLFLRKPIAIIGVGAGPLRNRLLKSSAVILFNKAKIVSVRDQESYNYMVSYGVKNKIHVGTDTAQAIEYTVFSKPENDNVIFRENTNRFKTVLVHAVETKHINDYINRVILPLRDYLFLDESVRFIISSDTAKKTSAVDDIARLFPEYRTSKYDFDDPVDFLELIKSVDAIVTPKLHVGIMGVTYNKSVLSFPIHPEKTKRYYRQIGYPNRCKELLKLSAQTAQDLFRNSLWEPIIISNSIKEEAKYNLTLMSCFFESSL